MRARRTILRVAIWLWPACGPVFCSPGQAEPEGPGLGLLLQPGQVRFLADCVPAERVASLLEEVQALGPRFPGLEGHRKTVHFLEERLVLAGYEIKGRQRFSLSVPLDTGSSIRCVTAHGSLIEGSVHAVWPNHVTPSFLPREGLKRRLIYAGKGTLSEFDGLPVQDDQGKGAVVLMEFACGDRWQNAALLGADAVLFLPCPDATAAESLLKFSQTPLQFPRFYVEDLALADSLRQASREQAEARLAGGMRWQEVVCENLLSFLPAQTPSDSPETLLVTVQYDAFSIVPGATRGGQSAGNLVSSLCALEALASEELGLDRRHHLLVLWDGARGMCNEGTRRFGAMLRDMQIQRVRAWERTGIPEGGREAFLRGKVGGMRPWMRDREQDLCHRIERLESSLAWLNLEADSLSSSTQAWLEEWIEDRVKGEQIQVLMESHRAERNEGVTPFTPDHEVSPSLLRLRHRRAYYRKILEREQLEHRVGALRDASTGSLDLEPGDVTLRSVLRELSEIRKAHEARLALLRESMELAESLRDYDVTRHVSVDLSPGSSVLTAHRSRFIGGDRVHASPSAMEWAWTLGPMTSQNLERVVDGANQIQAKNAARFDFADSVTFDASREKQTQAAETYEFHLELASAGVSGCTLITGNDPRSHRLGPGDQLPMDPLSLNNLSSQSRTLALILSHALIRPELFPHAEKNSPGVMGLSGKTVIQDARVGPFPKLPMPGCVVVLAGDPQVKGSVWMDRYALANPEGEFFFDEIPVGFTYDGPFPHAKASLEAFKFCETTGMLSVAPDAAAPGRGDTQTTVELWTEDLFRRLVVFEGSAIQTLGANDPMLFSALQEVRLLEGRGGNLEKWYVFRPRQPDPSLVALVPRDTSVKLLLSLPGQGHRMFLLGDQARGAQGAGHWVGQGCDLRQGVVWAARGLWRLNDERIRMLEGKGVKSRVASRLHEEATACLEQMECSFERREFSAAIPLARSVWGKELRVYPQVYGLSNEAVLAAVLLLAFLAPWALFLERLVCKAGSIQGRVLGWSGLFLAGFAVFYQLHPAFQISEAPLVLLVAYCLAGLSCLSLAMILGRYGLVMRQWRERTGGIHASDISRGGAFAVALNLGLTHMAKRPLQTALIVLMVSLLSFSVMTFTSVETELEPRKVPVPGAQSGGGDGLLFRMFQWATLSRNMAECIEQDLGVDCQVVRRMWYVRTELPWDIGLGLNKFVFTRMDTGKSATVECLQGFMPAEIHFTEIGECVQGRWFEGQRNEIILPTRVARELDITAEDVLDQTENPVFVQYGAKAFRVVGLLQSERADRVVDLSGAPLSHVDFYASGFSPHWNPYGPVGEEVDVRFMGFDRTVLLLYDDLEDLGGNIKSVVARFDPTVDASQRVETWMSRFAVNVYASLQGRCYLIKTVSSQSVQGAWKMFLPLLLVVLIMVNLMMGTVDERQEEIRMLGAVGLAPRHVSLLYLSESCVYGVLGLVFGVMLGLIVSRLTAGIDTGVSVNYASISTMGMGLLVLVVVVLSTVLPARRAARLASPSGASEWRMPEGEGDLVEVALPFTMTKRNGVGVLAFLHEYLEGHLHPTSPAFRCEQVRGRVLEDEDSEALSIEGKVYLAPYDMGVSQKVAWFLKPLSEGDLFRISYRAERIGGELQSWRRANFVFMDALRQQFLIYRTLSEERKRDYFQRAKGWFLEERGGELG